MTRRRRHRAFALACAVGLFAASCGDEGGDADDGPSSEESVETAATVADAAVDSIAVATPPPPPTTEPPFVDDTGDTTPETTAPSGDGSASGADSLTWAVQTPDANAGLSPAAALDFGAYAVIYQSSEHLVATDERNDLVPALATDWTSNADASEWTFDLREGVLFHDGTPLTADDVVWSIEQAVDLGAIGEIDSVVAIDDLTVSITTIGPAVELPYLVSDAVPQSAILRDGDDGFESPLIGTGPFVMESFDPTAGVSYTANPDWWNGAPGVEQLDFVFFDSREASANALLAGEVDGVAQISSNDRVFLAATDDVTVGSTLSNNHRQIWMRTDEGPFADVRVRQAFALSLDREALVNALFAGDARVANDQPVISTSPLFDAGLEQRTKDDDAALALLADAGFPDGVEVTLFVGDLAEIPILAELVAEQAASAGFDITVDVQPNSDFYGAAWCPALGGDGACNGESFGIVDYGHRPVPNIYFDRPFVTNGVWNSSNHADPVYDDLVAEFDDAPDLDAAAEAAAEIQRYLNEEVPVVIPYFFDPSFAHRSDLGNVTVTALGQPRLTGATTG